MQHTLTFSDNLGVREGYCANAKYVEIGHYERDERHDMPSISKVDVNSETSSMKANSAARRSILYLNGSA